MVTVNRKELLQAVTTAGKYTESKSVFPCICVDMTERMSVRSFSCEGAFEQRINRVNDDGDCPAFEINAAALSKIISKTKAEHLTMEMEENSWLKLSDSAGAVWHIVVRENNELLVQQPFDGEPVTISLKVRHIESICRCPPKSDDRRPHTLGVCLSGKDKAILGTNGNLLIAGKTDGIPDDMNVLRPRRAFKFLPKDMIAGGSVSIRIVDGGINSLYEIYNESTTIWGYLLQGCFPDISDLLSDIGTFDTVMIDADAMRYAWNQTQGILDQSSYDGAIVEFNEHGFKITATNPEIGELSTFEVPYKYDVPGVGIETAYKPSYILNAITGIKSGDAVHIRVPKDGQEPATFIYQDQTTVIMPMKL
jgi:DNA polymerase III sliding clamp (beta) subunit (PCNA family)